MIGTERVMEMGSPWPDVGHHEVELVVDSVALNRPVPLEV
jgi:hypothetical protein